MFLNFLHGINKKLGTMEARHSSLRIRGHIYDKYFCTVHPKQRECFFLHLLLVNVPGPTSVQYLQKVNDTLYDTFFMRVVSYIYWRMIIIRTSHLQMQPWAHLHIKFVNYFDVFSVWSICSVLFSWPIICSVFQGWKTIEFVCVYLL